MTANLHRYVRQIANNEPSEFESYPILEAMAEGGGPEKALVTLGYAGWAAGQLEHELSQSAWLTCPAEPNIVFETQAKDKLSAAAAKLGVDLNLLASDAGHA